VSTRRPGTDTANLSLPSVQTFTERSSRTACRTIKRANTTGRSCSAMPTSRARRPR
jgi:hypothetical protein